MINSKKIPYRTCVGCQEKKPKREMLRIIRTPEGKVEIDTTGKKSGRGTYLCYNMSCLKEALKKKKITKSLKVELSSEIIKELEENFQKLNVNSDKKSTS